MTISVSGAQHPPSSNGTINGPKAAKIGKQIDSAWVQFSYNVTKVDAELTIWPVIRSGVQKYPKKYPIL